MNTPSYTRYTPARVVEAKMLFSIPLYQRLFTWGKEQVEGLMFDLKQHFQTTSDLSPYYLGMLSCIKQGDRYDLIDGQQRFTVMTLMAIVLKKYDKEWESFLASGQRLNFVARPKDYDYIKDKIADNTPSDVNVQMENALECISQFMLREFNTEDGDKDREIFAQQVYERMSFFFSELPTTYASHPSSLNKYFEAMNACGKGLEQHEILKVQLLHNQENKEHLTGIWNAIADWNNPIIKKQETETNEQYRKKYESAIAHCYQRKFDEAFSCCESSYDNEAYTAIGDIEAQPYNFNDKNVESGLKGLISFSEFLMMVIDLYHHLAGSYSFYRKDLLNVYRENPIDHISDFYNQLLFYRLLLDFYIIHKEDDPINNKYNIVYQDGNTANALLQYQSMLYVSQTPFYNWMKPLLHKLHDRQLSAKDSLLDWVKDIDNSLRVFPTDVHEMNYKNGVDRYWLWRLDYYLWEHRTEYFTNKEEQEIVEKYVFRTNRSLEHLHPQHQANNEEWQESDVHSFGNLAMISQSFNSQQSDDPVTVKFARIMDQANNHALQSIKLYRMYLDAKKEPSGWTVPLKDKHQEVMYALLASSFPKKNDTAD